MIEVHGDLFVGDGSDFEMIRGEPRWAILQCAKEPWHREALGYKTRGAPKQDPEYFWAYRHNRLILNMVDAPQPVFFNPAMIDEGLNFIDDSLRTGKRVLVHCNQGNSRAPSVALLWMKRHSLLEDTFEGSMELFKALYPPFEPGMGIGRYVMQEFQPKLEAAS